MTVVYVLVFCGGIVGSSAQCVPIEPNKTFASLAECQAEFQPAGENAFRCLPRTGNEPH